MNTMRYSVARVVFNIGIDKAFDYRILKDNVSVGMRVWVEFNRRRRVGIVTDLLAKESRRDLNPVDEVLDDTAVLSPVHLDFARHLKKYYPYSLGEFLFMMVPRKLKNQRVSFNPQVPFEAHHPVPTKKKRSPQTTYVQASSLEERAGLYLGHMKEALKEGSVILCVPLVATLKYLYPILKKEFPDVVVLSSYQRDNEMLANWQRTRSQKKLILSTRLGLFLFPQDLRLLIVEDESSSHYFSQEKPYYHFIDMARYLSDCISIDLMVGFDYPDLSTYKLMQKKGKNNHLIRKESRQCSLEILSTLSFFNKKKGFHFNNLFLELVRKHLEAQDKVLILYNRRGYSTVFKCSQCSYVYRCKRCDSTLKSSVRGGKKKGSCSFCNYEEVIPQICPQCNSGYIKTLGLGIERLEAQLEKAFPQYKIDIASSPPKEADILVGTYGIFEGPYLQMNPPDVVFVLDADHYLARIDFEATLQLYIYLCRLMGYVRQKMYMFTLNKDHYIWRTLSAGSDDFYAIEGKARSQAHLPPYRHFAKVTLRAKDDKKLFIQADIVYNKLHGIESLEAYGPIQEVPFKLRGYFYYSIIVKSKQRLLLYKTVDEITKTVRSRTLKVTVQLR